jgi:TolB-like protein/Tfp pilus assembly protein PilF
MTHGPLPVVNMTIDPCNLIRIGKFTADPATGHLQGPDGEQRLEPRVMAVLACLAAHDGQVVSRESLIQQVWDGRPVVDEVLSRAIAILRRAFGDDSRKPLFIETLPKRGYRLLVRAETSALDGEEPASLPAPTLAVLPLQSLSSEPDDVLIADGVTELLIANLAMLAGLRVISRTSVMRYRDTTRDLPGIAAELGATIILEGTVFRSGGRIQVVAQLIDAASDTHLWAGQFQRQIEDLLDLQNEVTQNIARELHLGLPGAVERRAATEPLLPEAMELYLRSKWFLSKRTAKDCDRAIGLLEKSLALSPRFAAAAAALADAWILKALYGGGPPAEAARHARTNIDASLLLEPDNPDALASHGALKLFFEWDLAAARETLHRALALNPSHVLARLALADTWLAEADFRRALEGINIALQLSPVDLGLNMGGGDFLLSAGRVRQAIEQFRKVLEMDAGFHPARLRLAHALALAGDSKGAWQALEPGVPDGLRAKKLETEALVAAACGDLERAKGAAKMLGELAQREYVSPWLTARAFAAHGNADAAFEWLEHCFEERSSSLIFLGVNPAFVALRGDPRFRAALARLGLPLRLASRTVS